MARFVPVPLLIALVMTGAACAPLKSDGLLSGNMDEDELSAKLVDPRTYQHPNVTVGTTSFDCVDNSSQVGAPSGPAIYDT